MKELTEEEVIDIVNRMKPLMPFMIVILYVKSFMPVAEKASKCIAEIEMRKHGVV